MDRIAQLLARLNDLSPEELTELIAEIDKEFDERAGIAEPTPAQVADMKTLVEAAGQVRGKVAEREAEKAAAIEEAAALKAQMEQARNPKAEEPKPEEKPEGAKPEGEETAEEKAAREESERKQAEDAEKAKAAEEAEKAKAGGDGTGGGPIGNQPPAEVAAGAETRTEAPVPVVAAGAPRGAVNSHVARMAAAARAERSPEHRGTEPEEGVTLTLVAASGLPRINPGEVFTDPMHLAEAMSRKLVRMASSHDHNQAIVASAEWEFPEERTLTDDVAANQRKLDAVCHPTRAQRYNRRTGEALPLTASGGICLPVNVDYSVPTWATADRPVRDMLPAFQATRGGLRFVAPPDIGTVSLQGAAAGSGLATGIWTEATDANPSGATKPVWQVACGTEELVYVNAVTTRVEFGNMQSRFAPEQVAANTELAIAAAAREAELELLTLMYNQTVQVNPAQYLGATRDLLTTVDLLKEQYIYSHRFARNISLTAVFPWWASSLIRADIARELAHDANGPINPLAITDAQIEDWFSARGINVEWTMDALKAGTYGTGGSALLNQFFTKVTPGAKPQWPNQSADGTIQVGWLLFVTGTFQFLDGGRLDLGVVRDSVLDATNDYETFVETFEGVAFRGLEAYQVQSVVQPTGASAAALATTGYHE